MSSDKPSTESRAKPARVHRTLNVPFLIGSLVAFALVAGALYQVRAWQVSRTAVALLNRADQLEQEEKWFDAAANIQRYVQLMPLADQERIRLATVYAKGIVDSQQGTREIESQRNRAIDLYYRAIGTGVEDEQVPLRRKLAQLLIQNRRYLEARTEAEKLLSNVPGDAEALLLRAKALWGQWQTKTLARESSNRQATTIAQEGTNPVIISLEDALEANPSDIDVALALATAYHDRELKAFAKADRTLAPGEGVQELIEETRLKLADDCLNDLVTRAESAPAYLARHHYRTKWRRQGAAADIEQALRLAPENVEVLLAAAGAARQESHRLQQMDPGSEQSVEQLKRARDHYQKCLDVVGEDRDQLMARLGLGEVLLALGDRSAAIELWEEGLARHRSQPFAVEFLTRLAAIRLDDGDLEQAKQTLEEVETAIQNLPHYVSRDAVLALELDHDLRRGMLHMKRGEPRLAIPWLQHVLLRQEQIGGKSEHSVRALLMLGAAFAAQSDWTQSAEAYDRAGLQEPNLAVAHAAASTSWLAANAIDVAIERAEQAVRAEETAPSGPTCRSWFALASAIFRQQLLLPPADRVWSRLDQALLTTQQHADDGTLPNPWRVDLLVADCTLARGDDSQSEPQRQAEAVALLQAAEAKFPTALELWEELPLAYQRLGAASQADGSCLHLAGLEGGAQRAALVRVRLHSLRGEHEAAEKALLAAAQGPTAIDPVSAEQALIGLKLAQRDVGAGRKLLVEAHRQSPHDVNVLRRLAEIDLEKRSLDDVKTWEAALSQDPCGPPGKALALYFKIQRTLLEKPAKELQFRAIAEDHAELLRLRPNWAEAVALGGWIEELQMNPDDKPQEKKQAEQAIVAYQRAIALGEQRLAIFERLIRLLEIYNRSSEVESYLSRMRGSISLSHDLTVASSSVEFRHNQVDEAIEIARKGVRQRPQDPAAHIWLGQTLLLKRQDQEAEQEFKTAVQLKPDDVRAWNALFNFCLHMGRKQEARTVLDEIRAQVKLKPAELSFVLAQGYELLGDREQAAAAFSQADHKDPQVLLRMAQFHRGSDTEEAIKFARQAFQLDPSQSRKLLADVLSDRGNDEDWREIEHLLTVEARDAGTSTDDNRFRANLLARRGGARNLNKAVEILEELTSRPDRQIDSDHIGLAHLYERLGRMAADSAAAQALVDKAYQQLARLGDRATARPSHLIALIEFSQRHRQSEQADQWLARLAQLLEPMHKPASALLAEYVRLSMVQGNLEQAEKRLVQLETAAPDALSCIALRARLMEKQGKTSELDTFIESAAGRLLPRATRQAEKAAVCQGIGDLYASLKKFPLAEKWYVELAKASPQQFHRLVLVMTEQGRIQEALQVCRAQSDAKNVLPAALATVNVLAGGKASASEQEEGEALIAAALEQQPSNMQLLSAVATLRVIQNKTDDAVKLFARLVELNRRDPLALNNLATMLAEVDGRRDEALKLIDSALLIAGREPSLLDTKGTILWLKGDAAAAAANLEAASREPDADPRYRFHLALAYRDLNRTDDAKGELRRAIERDLDKQILTANERKLLTELRSQLSL